MALTRAKTWLYVCCPLRYYHAYRPGVSDRYGMAQRTRFLPESVLEHFDRQTGGPASAEDDPDGPPDADPTGRPGRGRIKDLWR